MIKLVFIILMFFTSCKDFTEINSTIKNKIYQTAIKFSNEKKDF